MTLWNLQQNVFTKSVRPTQPAPVWEHLMPGSLSAASKLCRYVWSSTKKCFCHCEMAAEATACTICFISRSGKSSRLCNQQSADHRLRRHDFLCCRQRGNSTPNFGRRQAHQICRKPCCTESLITYPIRQTHTDLTAEECAEKGITDCLLHFSTGIEATQDIIDDLAQAFAAAE